MKHSIHKKALTLLLTLTLLLGAALPVGAEEAGVRTPDFAALTELAAQERVPGVIRLTDETYYIHSISYNPQGRYFIFTEVETGLPGVCDVDGNVLWRVDDPKLDDVVVYPNGLCTVLRIDKDDPRQNGWQVYTVRGELLTPEHIVSGEYSLNRDWATGEALYLTGEVISTEIEGFHGGLLVDAAGHCIIAQGIGLVFNKTLPLCKDGKWALCDLNETALLPYVYDELQFVDANTLLAKQDGVYRLIDRSGAVVAELPGVTQAESFADACPFVAIQRDGLWGLCDARGGQTAPCRYSELTFRYVSTVPEEGEFCFLGLSDGNWQLFSVDGTVSIPLGDDVWAQATHPAQNLWYVKNRIVNDRGEALLPGDYNDCAYKNDRLILTQAYEPGGSLGKTVCFDSELNELFEVENTWLSVNTTRSALCCADGQSVWFYSLSDGTLLNRHDAGAAGSIFVNASRWGTLLQRKDGYALTDANGTLLTDFSYQSGKTVADGLFALGKNGVQHLFDCTGTELLGDFDEIVPFRPECSEYSAFTRGVQVGFLKYRAADEPMFADVGKGAWYAEGTDFCALTGLMNGMGGGKFDPQTDMTRAMLVRVLYNLSGSDTESFGFSDVPAGKWYTNAVNWAAANGIVNGMGDNRFAPDEPVTREQLVTILYRYAQSFGAQAGAEDALAQFSDAGSVSGYAKDAMRWAVQAGIVNGVTKTELSPQGTATRAQIAVILMRFVNRMAQTTKEEKPK